MTKTLESLSVKDLESLIELKKPERWEPSEGTAYQVRCIAEYLGNQSFEISDSSMHFIKFEFENKDFVIKYCKTNRYEYVPNPKKPAKYPFHFLKIKDVRVIVSVEYRGEEVYSIAASCNGFDLTSLADYSVNWEAKFGKLYEKANKKMSERNAK